MKHSILTLSILCLVSTSGVMSQTSDSLLAVQKGQIEALDKKCSDLSRQNTSLQNQIATLKQKADEAERRLGNRLDSLCQATANGLGESTRRSQELDDKLAQTNSSLHDKADSLQQSVSTKTKVGIGIAALLALVIGLVYLLLQRSKNKSIDALKRQSDELAEKMIGKMSSETDELRKIAESIGAAQQKGANANETLELVKRLADKISFLEGTLYRMDPQVRGYKQLSRSIKQMKDELKERGYELVDMLGKPYDEGMNLTANFVLDESLPAGARVITNVRKPQININGKMIQCADIVVSQNI